MPADSAYREACEAACEWCAKSSPRCECGNRPHHHIQPDDDLIACTAPTESEFAQSVPQFGQELEGSK